MKRVQMIQSMAAPHWSIIPGNIIRVRDDVAEAWQSAGIAETLKSAEGEFLFDLEVMNDVGNMGLEEPDTTQTEPETENGTDNGADSTNGSEGAVQS